LSEEVSGLTYWGTKPVTAQEVGTFRDLTIGGGECLGGKWNGEHPPFSIKPKTLERVGKWVRALKKKGGRGAKTKLSPKHGL